MTKREPVVIPVDTLRVPVLIFVWTALVETRLAADIFEIIVLAKVLLPDTIKLAELIVLSTKFKVVTLTL